MTKKRRNVRPAADVPEGPLVQALTWSGLGFPAEVWAAVATALGPETVTFTAHDAAAFAAAHPHVVFRNDSSNGVTYRAAGDSLTTVIGASLRDPSVARAADAVLGQGRVEDTIAAALVALYADFVRKKDNNVRSYLLRVLPDWCADGTGRGIEALRALPRDADVARMLGKALMLRADREREPVANDMRVEAVDHLTAAGQRAEAAEALFHLARGRRDAGDIEQALRTLERAETLYRELCRDQDFYVRFLALTMLDVGRLHRTAGRRKPAQGAMREALHLFERLAAEDHRFLDEVRVTRMELANLRWPWPVR